MYTNYCKRKKYINFFISSCLRLFWWLPSSFRQVKDINWNSFENVVHLVILFTSHFEILKHGYSNCMDIKAASFTLLWYVICWYNDSQQILRRYNIAFMFDEKSKIFPGVVGILNSIYWILIYDIFCCCQTTEVENISVPCSIAPLSWFWQFVVCFR
jgi:hypothetical protein